MIIRILIKRATNKCINSVYCCSSVAGNAQGSTDGIGQNDEKQIIIPPHKRPILPRKPRSKGEPREFVDYKRLVCLAGNGGNGSISFLRLKNNEFAGPDGGNGGNGGHVIFRADSKISDFSHIDSFLSAEHGTKGLDRCAHGKNGAHLYVPVPLNTLIKKPSADELRPSKEVIWELKHEGEMFIAARGGAGGHGNAFYVSNLVRKPLKAEVGGRGEKIPYDIEMRVMAIAGLVGFPNVGKSTLLRAISRAKPKVTFYPFSTISPSIGMIQYTDCFQVPVADIPGLVEGAHRNEGLGFSFLRHIVRCECILYVLDYTQVNDWDLTRQWATLRRELEMYDGELAKRESAIVVNKVDTSENQDKVEQMAAEVFPGQRVFCVSGKYRRNLDILLMFLREKHEKFLLERRAKLEEEKDQMMM